MNKGKATFTVRPEDGPQVIHEAGESRINSTQSVGKRGKKAKGGEEEAATGPQRMLKTEEIRDICEKH